MSPAQAVQLVPAGTVQPARVDQIYIVMRCNIIQGIVSHLFHLTTILNHNTRFNMLTLSILTRHKSFQSIRSFSTSHKVQLSSLLNTKLSSIDPDIYKIIQNEAKRQHESLALIPSENFTSVSVLESLGSIMQNKYSEGMYTDNHTTYTCIINNVNLYQSLIFF